MPDPNNTPPPNAATAPRDVSLAVEHLFRHEGANMVATLARIFGIENLQLAEDVVQEALARALQTWPYYGIPRNPAAWIMRASRNLALDAVRRRKIFRDKEAEIVRALDRGASRPEEAPFSGEEIADDRLRMMFVCCHPQIPSDTQAALALKALCGFGAAEIARAFLSTEAAIAKRITRAKQKIAGDGIPFEIPSGAELPRRLDGVLQALYLLFNEGYKASSGDQLIRGDICVEAVRLADLLAKHPSGNRPKTQALLALMLLNMARAPARLDAGGNLLRLGEQDRSKWDRAMIARGMFHLAQSAAGGEVSTYHLQAGIAACHCGARDAAATDWRRILFLYDQLLGLDPSPVAALNRAVALAEVRGPRAGIEAVQAIPGLKSLETYYLLHAVLGDFEWRLKHLPEAAAHFQKALLLAEIKPERDFLARRLRECETAPPGPDKKSF